MCARACVVGRSEIVLVQHVSASILEQVLCAALSLLEMIIIVIDHFCVALFSGVHKPAVLYNVSDIF